MKSWRAVCTQWARDVAHPDLRRGPHVITPGLLATTTTLGKTRPYASPIIQDVAPNANTALVPKNTPTSSIKYTLVVFWEGSF